VRVDSGLYAGLQVPLFYDPLLSKLIVWGKDRAHAIARLRRALDEYMIVGVRTTIPFARWLTDYPRFLDGDMSTDFIAEEWEPRKKAEAASEGSTSEEKAREGEGALSPTQVSALVGGLLLHRQVEEEKLRRRPAGAEDGLDGSRWKDAGRREVLRRL
jgi:acetyl/propionyl-CoA carboxylase alpha subunit